MRSWSDYNFPKSVTLEGTRRPLVQNGPGRSPPVRGYKRLLGRGYIQIKNVIHILLCNFSQRYLRARPRHADCRLREHG